jgi:hypothetical protein
LTAICDSYVALEKQFVAPVKTLHIARGFDILNLFARSNVNILIYLNQQIINKIVKTVGCKNKSYDLVFKTKKKHPVRQLLYEASLLGGQVIL